MSIKYLTSNHTPELRRGILIREKRIERKFSQIELAIMINRMFPHAKLTQPRVSDIERGSDLRASEMFYFADYFGVPVDRFRCFEAIAESNET